MCPFARGCLQLFALPICRTRDELDLWGTQEVSHFAALSWASRNLPAFPVASSQSPSVQSWGLGRVTPLLFAISFLTTPANARQKEQMTRRAADPVLSQPEHGCFSHSLIRPAAENEVCALGKPRDLRLFIHRGVD